MSRVVVAVAAVSPPSRRLPWLLLATLSGALPGQALGACFDKVSRIPMATPAPVRAAGPVRAAMLRIRPTPTAHRPAAPRVRPQGARARVHVVRAAHPRPKAAHRPRPVVARAAHREPAPYAVAAQDVATPAAYALISATVCSNGPEAPPRLMALQDVGPPIGEAVGVPPGGFGGPGGGTFFPPDVFIPPDTVIPTGGPGTPPTVVPPTSPPPETPPPGQPPVGPPVVPPDVPPDTPPVTPPVGPPEGPPPTPPPGPPVAPPDVPPDVPPLVPPDQPPGPPTAVPEPASWVLMLLGVGSVGAVLRRRRARSPGA